MSPAYFRKVVNFRNAMTHGYFGIDASEVWNVITQKLDILENDLLKIIQNGIDLSAALESEISEYRSLQNTEILNYLEYIKDKTSKSARKG